MCIGEKHTVDLAYRRVPGMVVFNVHDTRTLYLVAFKRYNWSVL